MTPACDHRLLRELTRCCGSSRLPVLALGGKLSAYAPGTVDGLRNRGYDVTIEKVPYEFQRGGNEMMRIRRSG
jgi:hypothetical protein